MLPGDVLQGHVVGTVRPGSSSSRFYVVDYGLKEEAIVTPRELHPAAADDGDNAVAEIGDSLSTPLVDIEDDFNEPVFDHNRQAQMSTLQAERYELLTRAVLHEQQHKGQEATVSNADFDSGRASSTKGNDDISGRDIELGPRMVYGRFSRFNRGGLSAKILGVDAFVPRHHVLALERPILGTFLPFYILSVFAGEQQQQTKHQGRSSNAGSASTGRNMTKSGMSNMKDLDVYPVVSSYGAALLCLCNLIGFDDAWVASGGGSAAERLAYLRLLTRILHQKNTGVRKMFPTSMPTSTASMSYSGRGGGRYQRSTNRQHQQMGEGGQHIPPALRMRRQITRKGRNGNNDGAGGYYRHERNNNNNNFSEGMVGEDNEVDIDSDKNAYLKAGAAMENDTAWLNELPTGNWASSGKSLESLRIHRRPRVRPPSRKWSGTGQASGKGTGKENGQGRKE